MFPQEIYEDLHDILNECTECFGTLGQHQIQCSDPSHKAIARILLAWEDDHMEDFERDDYEEKIYELESHIHTLGSDIWLLEEKNKDLNEKLRVWTELCSNGSQQAQPKLW